MRISDWSSDVCSSDLRRDAVHEPLAEERHGVAVPTGDGDAVLGDVQVAAADRAPDHRHHGPRLEVVAVAVVRQRGLAVDDARRSEEHTSELQSLMRISYAVFCLKKKKSIIQLHKSQHTPVNISP